MAEILIERCTLRVIRRTGWSWGPAIGSLLEQVWQRLPELLATKLEALFPEDAEMSIEAPLSIRLKFRFDNLDEGSSSNGAKMFASQASDFLPTEQQIAKALCLALDLPLPSPVKQENVRSGPQRRFSPTERHWQKPPLHGEPLTRFLFTLREKGQLESFLAAFSCQELELWHEAMARAFPAACDAIEERTARISEELERLVSPIAIAAPDDRSGQLRIHLHLAVEIAAQLGLTLSDPFLWIAIDRFRPITRVLRPQAEPSSRPQQDLVATDAPTTNLASSAQIVPEPQPIVHQRTPAISPSYANSWTTQVDSALPFLLLGPLHRLGYFQALAAVLEAAHLKSDSGIFAAAFAYKVLHPPERGWRRLGNAQHAAAVFAGLPHVANDEVLHEFSRQIAVHVGPLNRWLADSVISGRDNAGPVLLRRAESEDDSGFLLVDPVGCFPLFLANHLHEALLFLKTIGSPTVLVSAEASGPRILKEMHDAQLTFITEVPPVRGETWSAITQGVLRLGWTNCVNPSADFLAHAAEAMGIAFSEATALWEQIGLAHPAVPRAKQNALERSLTLAASVSLGILAWELWKSRGRTTPQLALERLGDMDAIVGFSEEEIQVGLPRGRRHSELLEAGFLAPVPDVPWFHGRRVIFGWG